VLHVDGGRIVGFSHFLDTDLYPLFGLPQHPDDPRPDGPGAG
jgi:RNA polymerase sigma-70 factor (ECF subfamily)